MKRTRKTRKTFTNAQKRGLVNEVIRLVNEGTKVTTARIEVAFRHKTTPISLARWSKDITNTTVTRSNGKIVSKDHPGLAAYKKLSTESLRHTVNKVNNVHVTGVDLHVPGKGIVKLDHELLTHISKLASYTG